MKKTTTKTEPETKNASESKTSSQKDTMPKPAAKKSFLVVGLGASAGGVKALQEFFSTMPPNSGMAFVVILHLSPEHESSLAQIIQAQTSMQVVQVNETHKVEPNFVYVIPPNHQLEMIDGVVRCTAPSGKLGARVAIDVFFRTLADAYQRNAVCVVLSGTGTDGTLGLKAVKESNGFAIVQDPQDAEYDGMPRSAIATDLVDWILPVRQMADNLINFRNSSDRLYLTDGDDGKVAKEIQADESLREILTLLRVRTGHDFSNYKMPTLIRRVARHLQIHDLEDIPAYLAYLRENPGEIQSLMKNLLINVTNFFRDREAFEALESEVIPNLFHDKKAKDTVRVWACGCASGEEAYSLAMLLTEYAYRQHDPPKIQVFATDVDEDAISEAREHRYPETIEADVSPERLKRFFVKEGAHYRIKKELRETVLFAPHNVLRDPPFSRLDLITCRNLLIYLNRETQDRVMEIFHFALAPHGYMFLGSSETADGTPNLFAPLNKKYRLYTRRPAPQTQFVPKMPLVGKWQLSLPERKRLGARGDGARALGEMHYKLLETIAPPSILVNKDFDVLYLSESASRFLRLKGGEPSSNLLKLINPDLLADLRAALFSAQRERKTVEFENVHVRLDDAEAFVNLNVRTVDMEGDASDYLLVVIEENKSAAAEDGKRTKSARDANKDDAMEAVVRQIEEELIRTKSQLRTTIEQHEVSIEELKASNEELQAINEELRSASEELETSKEELQSVNEELTTVNHELKEKIDETTRANSDLQNLMSSTDIATIFLDRSFRIKRITPLAEQLFNITPLDVGRPLEHFTHHLDYENLLDDVEQVLRSLLTLEREISDNQNRTFIARLAPYRTIEDRIEGVVLSFIDITKGKRAEKALHVAETRMRLLVESAKDYAIFTLDLQRRVNSWNSGAQAVFGYAEKEIIGKSGDILFTPEDRAQGAPESEAENALAKGRAENERWHIRRNKTRFWGSGVTMTLRDDAGNAVGFVKIMRDITEQKKLEEAKFFLAAILESSEDSTISINFDGIITSWNKAAEKLYGYTAQEAIGKPLTMLTLPADLQEVLANSDKIKHGKAVKIFDTIRLHKDGRELHLEVMLSPVKNVKGRIIGVSTVARDITARIQAEESIRFQANLLDTVEQSVIATDLDGTIIYWNQFAERLFGWTAKEAMGRSIMELTTPQIMTEQANKIMSELRRGKSWSGEFTVQRRDGTTFPAQVFNTPIIGEKKTVIGIIGVSVDITERKASDEALRASEDRYRAVVDGATDYAIFTLDENNKINSWSKGAQNIFGWKEKEIIGSDGAILFTPEDRQNGEYLKELKTARRTGRAEDERWHIRRDSSLFFASGMMMRLDDGASGFVKICRDETERVKAEAVQRDKEMLSQLVSTQEDERRRIAREIHDHVGQQLTVLRLKLEEVKKMCDDQRVCDEIEAVQEITVQLDREVDFLAWELRPASLDDLGLRVSLANFVKEWSRHTGIKGEFHATGLKRSRLDFEVETSLYRIAQEALNNIYKHAQPKNVSVLLEKRKDKVSLIIEDDGVGFNPKDKRNRSKGIGLVGMIERAKICGGELDIESSKGNGTTVFARVPLKKKK